MSAPGEDIAISSELGDFRFGIVPDWVLLAKDKDGKGLSGADLRVYISMRTFANKGREAYPKVKTIAERADVTVRTAEKSISRLRTMGLIVSRRWYRDEAKKEIGGCHYKMLDFDPTGHMDGRGPAKRTEGFRPDDRKGSGEADGARRDQSKRPSEETKGTEVQISVHASGADGDDTSNPNLRDVDRAKLTDIFGDRFRSNGLIWTKGEFNTTDFYKPLYEKLTQQRNGKPAWPGCFVEDLVNSNRFDDWLMEQGLELIA